MNIKILGPGCINCERVEKLAKDVVGEMQIDATFDHVTQMDKIMKYPIMSTPGLVINEEVVMSGRIPSKAEVTQFIINALAKEEQAAR